MATLTVYPNITPIDNYLVKDDAIASINTPQTWECQTFTPAKTQYASSVRLWLRRYTGNGGGTLTLSIRATSGGEPTGSDLVSATYDSSTIDSGVAGQEVIFTFSTPILLTASTKYAIILRASAADGDNFCRDYGKVSSSYSGGNYLQSDNSGSTWNSYSYDLYFQVFGNTVDGFAGRITDESWTNKRTGAGTHSSPSNTLDNLYLAASASGNNWNSLYRLLMLFDTSALTAGASISSAKLKFYPNAITNTLGKIGERFYDAENGGWAFGTGKFLGQKFTVGNTGANIAHTVKFLNLKLYKTGNPGTVEVLIQGVSGGLPDGNTLCSGTIDGNSLTTDTNGAWYKINMGAGGNLSPSTQYCYIVKATSGDSSNRVFNMRDPSSPSYTGGDGLSYDTPNWSSISGIVYVFEVCYSLSVDVVASTPASNNNIVNADYSQLGTTKLSTEVLISALTTGQYNEITLNATGIAAISKTGITKLGLRLDCDVDNIEPSWQASAEANIQLYMADGTYPPYLEIEYITDITINCPVGAISLSGIVPTTLTSLTIIAVKGAINVITNLANFLVRGTYFTKETKPGALGNSRESKPTTSYTKETKATTIYSKETKP